MEKLSPQIYAGKIFTLQGSLLVIAYDLTGAEGLDQTKKLTLTEVLSFKSMFLLKAEHIGGFIKGLVVSCDLNTFFGQFFFKISSDSLVPLVPKVQGHSSVLLAAQQPSSYFWASCNTVSLRQKTTTFKDTENKDKEY